jgi:hypothetical protein
VDLGIVEKSPACEVFTSEPWSEMETGAFSKHTPSGQDVLGIEATVPIETHDIVEHKRESKNFFPLYTMSIRRDEHWEGMYEVWGDTHQRVPFVDRDAHPTHITMLEIP